MPFLMTHTIAALNSPGSFAMKHPTYTIVAMVLSMLGITACSPASPDVEFLASDLHFLIGGNRITVPGVALRGPGHSFDLYQQRPQKSLKEKLMAEATDPDHPMRTDKINLAIRQYQYTGESLASIAICQHLRRIWSQSECRGQQRGLLDRLPVDFDLLDRAKLDILASHWTVGGERKFEQVKDKVFQLGVTKIGCDRRSHFCTAVVEALPNLLAVWTVWSDEKTGSTAEQMANAQGIAIVEFIRRALGPTEDPTLLNAD